MVKRGGGYSTNLSEMLSAGNPVYQQYDGAGKDCPGNPVRPGYMDLYSSNGLPGLSGGRRSRRTKRSKRSKRSRHRGGTILQPAPYESMPALNVPQAPQAPSAPSAPPAPQAPQTAQKGGRYGIFPEMGPLNPVNGVGAAGLAPFASIPCEASRASGMDLHRATTAYLGGKRGRKSGGAFPVVHAGAADAMSYRAPTAGYGNDFEAFSAGGAVPGLMLQTPYDARAGNPACGMSGGAINYADSAASYSGLSMDQLGNRSDFDGTTKGLPVKYGGFRRSFKQRPSFKRRPSQRRSLKQNQRQSGKYKKHTKHQAKRSTFKKHQIMTSFVQL